MFGETRGNYRANKIRAWYEYARLIEEIRPKYAVIENVKGLLSKGMEIVLSDLSSLGYDAEWTCLLAAAFGVPHLRERVFIVAYPNGCRAHGNDELFAPLQGILGEYIQSGSIADWLGIRIDRSDRQATRRAYGGPVLCRVDDRGPERIVQPGWRGYGWGIKAISKTERRAAFSMLRALGNGITPRQAYAVARYILHAEGLR